jgi:hypothetical protein
MEKEDKLNAAQVLLKRGAKNNSCNSEDSSAPVVDYTTSNERAQMCLETRIKWIGRQNLNLMK